MTWLIYGASGHTGALVAELAKRRGEHPVLAGRSASRLRPLAERLGFDYRVFDLDDPIAVRQGLDGMEVVAHCAGPFSVTSAPMVSACMQTRTHYLDITGEIGVFEAVYAQHDDAVRAGVVLLPGGGFDVVPTDCVAATLAQALPSATHLDLAFKADVTLGPGTVKTVVEGAGHGGYARVDGELRAVRLGHRRIRAEFPSGVREVTSIPWGDVVSAYRSTGIPNVTTYTVVPFGAVAGVVQRVAGPLLRLGLVQRAAKALVDRVVKRGVSPDEEGRSEVWGAARDASGKRATMTLTGPNGLPMTADAVLRAVRKLRADGIAPGAHTPATAFGANFAAELDGVELSEPVLS